MQSTIHKSKIHFFFPMYPIQAFNCVVAVTASWKIFLQRNVIHDDIFIVEVLLKNKFGKDEAKNNAQHIIANH